MNIKGYFKSIKRANDTVAKLNTYGFEKAYTDIMDNISTNLNLDTNLPGTETSGSNSGLVLNSQGHILNDDPGKSPLEAASPMVSGMGGFQEITDFNCRVVVDLEPGRVKEVEKILCDMGGTLENPDLKTPEHLKGIKNEDVNI